MRGFILLSWVLSIGCTRQADIYDEPEAIVVPPIASAGDVPSVPDLGLDDFPECSRRPEGACRAVNDFPCGFADHAKEVIDTCFRSTECSTYGWVSVTLGEDGCLSDIGMEVVDSALVECLKNALGPVQCPCSETKYTAFLPGSTDGCRDDVGPRG